MRVAIVHPWFLVLGGGEKVIEELAELYPEADIFVLFSVPQMVPASIRDRRIYTTFLNRIPWIRKLYRELMLLYPTAIESLDLSTYDLVISSSGPVTFGINIRQDALHICYCHSPGRSWWDQYAERQRSISPFGKIIYTALASYVRMWEFSAAQRVDYFIANSHYIAQRIRKYLRRDAMVIYPPVNISMGYCCDHHADYYLSVGRLEERKRLDLLVHACNQLQRHLVIVGIGTEEKRLKRIAGPTVEFRGHVSNAELTKLYAECRAFLFAADEDFGIAPVEAQAFGRPVIAYKHGGALETVRDGETGVFFDCQTVDSLVSGIQRFEGLEDTFIPNEIRHNVTHFDAGIFKTEMLRFVEDALRTRAQ